MTLPLSLELLPLELTCHIIALLELPDLLSLRLASNKLCTGINFCGAHAYFARDLRLKNSSEMAEFESMTEPGRVGCLLTHIRFIGSNDISTEIDMNLVKHLAQIFTKLQSNARSRDGLGLILEVDRDPLETHSIWKAAGQCFQVVMKALSESKLSINSLDLFSEREECGLPFNDLTNGLQHLQGHEINVFSRLKQFTICLSQSQAQEIVDDTREVGADRVESFCKLLRACTSLDTLELRWLSIGWLGIGNTPAMTQEEMFFDRLSQTCQFPNLRHGTLENIYTLQSSLANFFMPLNLESVVLKHIKLHDGGSFRSILYHITDMERLKFIHLDELREATRLHFGARSSAPDRAERDSGNFRCDITYLTRSKSDVRQPIDYFISDGCTLGCMYCHTMRSQWRSWYGPKFLHHPSHYVARSTFVSSPRPYGNTSMPASVSHMHQNPLISPQQEAQIAAQKAAMRAAQAQQQRYALKMVSTEIQNRFSIMALRQQATSYVASTDLSVRMSNILSRLSKEMNFETTITIQDSTSSMMCRQQSSAVVVNMRRQTLQTSLNAVVRPQTTSAVVSESEKSSQAQGNENIDVMRQFTTLAD